MPSSLQGKLVVAVSSRALFDLDEAHQVFALSKSAGADEYIRYQLAHEEEVLSPGVAFHLVKRLSDNPARGG